MYFTYVEVDVHCKRNRVHCSVDSEDPVLNCNKIKLNNLVQLNIFWGKGMSITFTIMLFRLVELKFNNLTRVQWLLKCISGQFSKGRKLRNIPTGFKHTRGDQKVRGKVL